MVRGDESLRFESVQRAVDRSERDVSAGGAFELAADVHAVSVLAQPQQRQDHELLEIAQKFATLPTGYPQMGKKYRFFLHTLIN